MEYSIDEDIEDLYFPLYVKSSSVGGDSTLSEFRANIELFLDYDYVGLIICEAVFSSFPVNLLVVDS